MDNANERLAQILDRSGDYRILRRVRAPIVSEMTNADRVAAGLEIGILLDTETTGLEIIDEIVELGMVRFAFDPNLLRIDHLVGTFSAFRQPSRPIPPDVQRLTGISNEDVVGHRIDPDAVAAFVEDASIIVAHNATFDRSFCERIWPFFEHVPWACSLTQVDWRTEGFEGRKLGQLLAERRMFHDGHRALDDCLALLHLLGLPLASGKTAFEIMMREAAQVVVRIWAVASPFGAKGLLKARRYRWANGENGSARAWWRDVPEASVDDEIAWLREHVYEDPFATPILRSLTPFERFSIRCEVA